MNRYHYRPLLLFVFCLNFLPTWVAAEDKAKDAAGIEFFEQKIRPVLVQHCYACHSVAAEEKKKLQGHLYLDNAAGIQAGGESGPVIVKEKPVESSLVKALRYDGLEMPPAGKLPDEIAADFVKWIEMGAPDPRGGSLPAKAKREINLEDGKKFWSFQPVHSVEVPKSNDARWSQPIDRFIAAKHIEKGLKPAGTASKEKLIRRAYFDLIGLPPTPEQIDAFVNDESPKAFEKVIDELLASERYGERWGRHWLDVARYAESGGYEFDGFRSGAYHYRDWVIKAFNQDLPYNEFVRLQLAGDSLLGGYEGASATGFLVAGPYPGQITQKTVERIRYDQLDDMLMTIGGSMMGLTLGCVRCHEHKYDPIPHQDYYALAASLARTGHGSVTHDSDPADTERKVNAHAEKRVGLWSAWEKLAKSQFEKKYDVWQKSAAARESKNSTWQRLDPISVDAEGAFIDGGPEGLVVYEGRPKTAVVARRRKQPPSGDVTYTITYRTYQKNLSALRIDLLPEKSLPKRGPGTGTDGSFGMASISASVMPIENSSEAKPTVLKLQPLAVRYEETAQPFANTTDGKPATFWRAKDHAGKANAAAWKIVNGFAGFDGGSEITIEMAFKGDPIGRLMFSGCFETQPNDEFDPSPVGQAVATVGYVGQVWELNSQSPFDPPALQEEVEPQHRRELLALRELKLTPAQQNDGIRWLSRYDDQAKKVVAAVEEHDRQLPRPSYVDVYTTIAGGQDVYLLRRGEVDNKQGKASPGVVQVLFRPSTENTPPTIENKDPRVGLADWLTNVEQGAGPLVARVIVNRVWQHHFGEGIVGTPNDFGVQGERPTHPELLEWLTADFIQNGWKLKTLHKQILLSATWQQANDFNPDNVKVDPANRYLWHYKPRRLEAENIRDALLAVGGNLDSKMYGPSVMDNTTRRSVYLRVKRSELVPFMTMFDAPEPTQSQGTRISTTVPTQALLLMNSPFTRQQAEKLAARVKPKDTSLETGISAAYRIVFGRSPSDTERQRMLAFIGAQTELAGGPADQARDKAFVEFCHTVLCLNEFVYID